MPAQMPAFALTIPAESFELYVFVEQAARYFDLKNPRHLWTKARNGQIPAYAWADETCDTRHFKISQLDDRMKSKLHSPDGPPFPKGEVSSEKKEMEESAATWDVS